MCWLLATGSLCNCLFCILFALSMRASCVCGGGGSSWLITAIFPSRVFPGSMSPLSLGLMGVNDDEVHSAPGSMIQCVPGSWWRPCGRTIL
jgi:hypothetical protein